HAHLLESVRLTLGISEVPPTAAQMLYEWSGGLPVLAWDCVRHWLSTGQMTLSYDSFLQSKTHPLTLPQDSSEHVARLLDSLSASDRRQLTTLSVSHRPLLAGALSHVSGIPIDPLLDRLRYMSSLGLVTSAMKQDGEFYQIPSVAIRSALLS